MHPVKLSANFQGCPVPGLWDIKPHKQAAAHTEKEEYKEAETPQMLLLRDFIKRKRERERKNVNCLSVLLVCVIVSCVVRMLTTRMGKTIPTTNRLVQFRVQATVYPADL